MRHKARSAPTLWGRSSSNRSLARKASPQKDHGTDFFEKDQNLAALEAEELKILESVEAIVLGANTYKMFVKFWPTEKSKDTSMATWINSHPIHVVSNSLQIAPWGKYAPANLERGDGAKAVAAVRDRYRGDVIVWGSLQLTKALFLAKIVDRLRLRSVPRLLGAGVSVAPRSLGQTELTLADSKVYSSGIVVLDYMVG
jgi:dihydrofolate reductase